MAQFLLGMQFELISDIHILGPFTTCEYTTYAMIAWYSRERSPLAIRLVAFS
jgi:hypothetical protein